MYAEYQVPGPIPEVPAMPDSPPNIPEIPVDPTEPGGDPEPMDTERAYAKEDNE
ncbi:MAG TPA: hypothetical protein VMD91_17680 [Candidatus Sulfotelmatobacter sp.]|nr:hypothetical protein [Candidatus Sulfotelmatobacter sp.]